VGAAGHGPRPGSLSSRGTRARQIGYLPPVETIYAFLHESFADWDLGYVLPELISGGRNVRTFAMASGPVRSLGGLHVVPDIGIEEVDLSEARMVILAGGTFWRDFRAEALDRLVREARSRRVAIAGICAATGYLARLGVLDEVAHTSNSLEFLVERAPAYAGAARYRGALAVSDEGVITASGLGAAEFTYEILESLGAADAGMWYRAFKLGEEPEASPHRFVVLLSKVAGHDTSAETIGRHIEYLRELDRDGRLVAAGPFVDHASGLVVIRADDRAHAVRIASSDPFVLEGVRSYEVRTWMPAHRQNGYLGAM